MKVSLLRKIWIILFLSVLGTSVHAQVMPERRKSPPQSQSLRSYNRFLDERNAVESYTPLARKGGLSLPLRQMHKSSGNVPTKHLTSGSPRRIPSSGKRWSPKEPSRMRPWETTPSRLRPGGYPAAISTFCSG